jgi:hypothetical protein
VSCAVYRVDGDRVTPASVVGPREEVLLVGVEPTRTSLPPVAELTVELYQGDHLRDRHQPFGGSGAR